MKQISKINHVIALQQDLSIVAMNIYR